MIRSNNVFKADCHGAERTMLLINGCGHKLVADLPSGGTHM